MLTNTFNCTIILVHLLAYYLFELSIYVLILAEELNLPVRCRVAYKEKVTCLN